MPPAPAGWGDCPVLGMSSPHLVPQSILDIFLWGGQGLRVRGGGKAPYKDKKHALSWFIPISWLRKLRLRKGRKNCPSHTASKQ